MRRRRGLAVWVASGLVAAAAGLLLAHWVPPQGAEHSVCTVRRLTAVPCPGCGLTRAFAHLAKGELGAALALHPLAPLLALEAVAAWLAWGAFAARGKHLAAWSGSVPVAVANAALLVLVWLGRLGTGTLPP